MRTPYDVLGVSRTADEKAVKTAFRKLAKRYHPDSSKEPNAKERFAEVNQAYEIVGDKEKRRKYDGGEIDEQGNEKFAGFEGFGGGGGFGRGTAADGFETFTRGFRGGRAAAGGMGAEDILSQMFGGAMGGGAAGGFAQGAGGDPFAGMRGAQARSSARPQKGADRKINLAVTLKDLAEGKASVRLGDKRVAVKIPPEAKDATVVRLKGQGEQGPAGPGDALVTLEIVPHSDFQRFGTDLKTHVAVPFETAVLGGKVRVPTLTGAVALNVPEWTRAGTTMRVRGKGLPKRSGGSGDILVSLAVDLPEEKDERLVAAARAGAEVDA